MEKKKNYFNYDGIIFIDETVNNYFEEIKKLINKDNRKYLILLLDDRNYSLREKNVIKGYSDKLELDILMFTLKPQYLNILNKKNKDFKILRSVIRLNWILNCLYKYDVKNAYLNFKIITNLKFVYKNNFDLFIKLRVIINKKIKLFEKK